MKTTFVTRSQNVWGFFAMLIQELTKASPYKTLGIHMYYSADIRDAKKLLKCRQIGIELHQEA